MRSGLATGLGCDIKACTLICAGFENSESLCELRPYQDQREQHRCRQLPWSHSELRPYRESYDRREQLRPYRDRQGKQQGNYLLRLVPLVARLLR